MIKSKTFEDTILCIPLNLGYCEQVKSGMGN